MRSAEHWPRSLSHDNNTSHMAVLDIPASYIYCYNKMGAWFRRFHFCEHQSNIQRRAFYPTYYHCVKIPGKSCVTFVWELHAWPRRKWVFHAIDFERRVICLLSERCWPSHGAPRPKHVVHLQMNPFETEIYSVRLEGRVHCTSFATVNCET
jgi:hypothetical protein